MTCKCQLLIDLEHVASCLNEDVPIHLEIVENAIESAKDKST